MVLSRGRPTRPFFPNTQGIMAHASEHLWHGTTILSVRKGNTVLIAGDGQVSLGDTVV